jgi:protein-S-isoprenylcysteine O-methyltransferase Ste14
MSPFKLAGGIVYNSASFAVALLVPAHTLHWTRAWIFLAINLVCSIISTVILHRANTGILEQRFKSPLQKGQPLVDKCVVIALIATFGLAVACIPLDVFHGHLLGQPPLPISLLGLPLFIAGWWIMTLALRENAYATLAVRHLAEREQKVIDTGVYSVVRHPMYAGFTPLLVGMALWLQSYAAALFSLVPLAIVMIRIILEEKFLRRELPGYTAYTQRVRYRLIPRVW